MWGWWAQGKLLAAAVLDNDRDTVKRLIDGGAEAKARHARPPCALAGGAGGQAGAEACAGLDRSTRGTVSCTRRCIWQQRPGARSWRGCYCAPARTCARAGRRATSRSTSPHPRAPSP